MMACRLSITNLSAALILCGALGLYADVPATVIRNAGASIDTSMRNEVEHAVDLAAEWLAACQNKDGSWGSETGRVERTAVCLIALTARKETASDALARAAVWLDGHAPAERDGFTAYSWRIDALLSVVEEASARTNLATRLIREARGHVPENQKACGWAQWQETLARAGQGPLPALNRQEAAALACAAQAWPSWAKGAAPGVWPTIHLINRAGGTLELNGVTFDWRREVAQNLINAQRRAPAAGGYWGQAEGDARIRETAFGILALLEL